MNLELINKTALVPGSTKGMATGTEGTGVSNGDLYFPETFFARRVRIKLTPPDFTQMRKASRFEELFLPHLDAAYSIARWIVKKDQDAQDVVQEAYARALKGFSGFRGDNPRAWLLTIVRDTGYSWIKKQLNDEKLIPSEEKTRAVPVEVVPSELSQERRRQLLEKALDRLPAKFRELLVLFEIERWSYKAIAAALNVRLRTVMSRLNRARRRLQQEITQVRDRDIEEEL